MIKDIIIKANDLLMRNALRIFSKSRDKYIFEVFDDSDNQKYDVTLQMSHNTYYLTCSCYNGSIKPNSMCSHKWSAMKLVEMDVYKLK